MFGFPQIYAHAKLLNVEPLSLPKLRLVILLNRLGIGGVSSDRGKLGVGNEIVWLDSLLVKC
jgi:hypothetical protein